MPYSELARVVVDNAVAPSRPIMASDRQLSVKPLTLVSVSGSESCTILRRSGCTAPTRPV